MVRDAPERSRYEAVVDGDVAGFADYRQAGDRVVFLHVEVSPERQGNGIATRLVREAMDDVVSRGKTITPRCPFAVAFVQSHPEYQQYTG
jgi:predicted GNAT family acetyltransferase